jgi:hypothetical protein
MARFSVSDVSCFSDGQKSREFTPVVTISYVQAVDIDGVDYVTGCEGKPKAIVEYGDSAKTRLLTTTTLKYTDVLNPTKVTDVEVV